jgi:hypothetical protein
MDLLLRLRKNKGTVSSALSKKLAQKALAGDWSILDEAVALMTYQKEEPGGRAVRSAAAKIIEIIAAERPEKIVPHLKSIFPALEVGEPQTRWAAIRIFGFCASLAPAIALEAMPFAAKFTAGKEGLCLRSSADLFLGDVGALSPAFAARVFPLLEKAMETRVKNEEDWLLETLGKVFERLRPEFREKAVDFAKLFEKAGRAATRKRAARILAAGKTGASS